MRFFTMKLMTMKFFAIMKQTILLFILSLSCLTISAQVVRENVEKDLYITAGVHHPYNVPEKIADTKAPKGFKPFYVTHYGRHGSRLHTSEDIYRQNVPILQTLAEKGLLTETGLAVKAEMEWLQQQHDGMAGTLTVRGGMEQQGVAERLYKRCKGIFTQKGSKIVTSRATNVHRVIQSMAYFNASLKACQRDLQISMMTGNRYWDVLCFDTRKLENPNLKRQEEVRDSLHRVYVTALHPEQFFKDVKAVEEMTGLSAKELEYKIFEAVHITHTMDNIEGHDPLALFSIDDLVSLGRIFNIVNCTWFMHSIESGYVNELGVGRPILRDILQTAEGAIAGNGHCADFRFGHDSGVGPLAGMLEIGDYAKVFHLEESPDKWPAYKNICMCSNIQIILYRNNKSEVLVKVLFNEEEVAIGKACPAYSGPYYRWEDFRSFVQSKL